MADEADDNDEEDLHVGEEEEDSVPIDVIEVLPRRTFVRFFRQAASALTSLYDGPHPCIVNGDSDVAHDKRRITWA